MRPIDGWNVTTVPLCTGVPADSVTTARDRRLAVERQDALSIESEIVEPVGEVSGTLSHARRPAMVSAAMATNGD